MSEKSRTIECGYLCENMDCLAPLPDSPPLADDWRVPVGRTKRLCPTCAEKEDRELWEQINQLGKDTDALKRLGTSIERMFRASGVGPRTKMKRFKDER